MSKIDREWVEAYFSYGIDITNRRVFLDSDIEDDSASPVIKGLYLMETISKTEPIEMFISSYGGIVYESLAIYDIMHTISCPIHTFGYGKIMSAAILLIAAGEKDQRWLSPNAALMHHDWSADFEGKNLEIASAYKHQEDIGRKWISLLADHTNQTKQWWTRQAKKPADFYFTAEEALEWGVADHTWVEK